MSLSETATQAPQPANVLLEVNDLRVTFATPDGDVTAVNDLNFTLRAGETLGIVGESGSGKSQTAFALMGLLATNGRIGGSATFNGREILNLPERETEYAARRTDFDDFSGPDDLAKSLYARWGAVNGSPDAA